MAPTVTFAIRSLEPKDLSNIVSTNGGAAWNGGTEKWTRYLDEQTSGRRFVLLATRGTAIVGYGSLLWNSDYLPFRDEGVPEIKDVVVAEPQRRLGVGRALISALERSAGSAGHSQVGIAVGLYGDYGPAQRLYVRLGFVPDGRGITSGRAPAVGGALVKVDDDLLLWFVKPVSADVTP